MRRKRTRCASWLALCLLLRRTDGPGRRVAEPSREPHRGRPHGLRRGRLPARSPHSWAPSMTVTQPAAVAMARQAATLGDRFGDPDLRALGTLGHGQALIALGEPGCGTARLDDVMVSVAGGEVGPITSGIVYSAVVLECMRLFDFAAQRRSGPTRSACGATPNLISSPTAASVWSIDRSCSRPPANGGTRS